MLNASEKLELSPEGKTTVSAKLPINNCSVVCYSTVGFLLALKVLGGTPAMGESLKS